MKKPYGQAKSQVFGSAIISLFIVIPAILVSLALTAPPAGAAGDDPLAPRPQPIYRVGRHQRAAAFEFLYEQG
jgi:hypothetical protein